MSDVQQAGETYAHRFCQKCDEEILADDTVIVNVDGDSDGERFHDLTTVRHQVCPEACDGHT